MISDVSICNLGLTMLSTARINSLTEDSENARKCNAVYEMLRDSLLSEHNWNFAISERILAAVDDTPTLTDNWTEVHAVPSDCLRIIRMEYDYPFKREGNYIFSNVSSPKIEYVKRVTDPTRFSSGFIKALAAQIASALAFGITQNATLHETMLKIASQTLREAKWSDAQEGMGTTIQSGSLLEER